MDHVVSTHLFVNHRLTTVWLEKLWDAGVPAVEIFCAKQHFDYTNRAQVNELAAWFRDSPMKLWALHLPMHSDEVSGRSGPQATITITEPVKGRRIEMVDELKRAIEVAERIPCRYLVQHLGVGAEEFHERKLDAAFTCLDELNIFARQRGAEILLENIPNELSSAERLNYFLEITHLSNGYCFDTGHAHIEATRSGSTMAHEFELMKSRIRSTHVHDNNGVLDNHRVPFFHDDGKINWKELMELLRSRPGQYPLNLEIKESVEFPNPFEILPRIFERLESQ